MYTAIDAVGLAVSAAKEPGGVVVKDRERFVPFLEAAEKYAREHRLVVGGGAATRLLLDIKPGPEDYHYEFYSSFPLRDARALADIFYLQAPEGLGHYSAMLTRVPHREFELAVDERRLVTVKALAAHRGARPADILSPLTRPAAFARLPLLCMGAEMQLIGVYRMLSEPSEAGRWADLLRTEAGLRSLYFSKARAVSGGKGGPAAGENAARDTPLSRALWKSYVPAPGHALVGGAATGFLSGKHRKPPERLQIVSMNSFAREERAVMAIAAKLGYDVQSAVGDPHLPAEPQLRRMTMYIIRPGHRREAFLDVYNAAAHNLVGYITEAGIPLANLFTIMRFLLVDAWIIQLLTRMDKITNQYSNAVLKRIARDFKSTAHLYLQKRDAGEFTQIFPPNYIGNYQDPVIAAKRMRYKAARRPGQKRGAFRPYYPAATKSR